MEEILSDIRTFTATGEQPFSTVKLIEDIYRGLGLPLPDPTVAGQVFGIATVVVAMLLVLAYVYNSFFTQKIFKKTGTVPSWSAWVPIYGQWKFLEAGKQKWWLIFVPVVNVIFTIVAAYRIGIELRKGGGYILLYFLIPWLWLILLSSKRVTAISEGAVNDEYIPPEEPEPERLPGPNNGGNNLVSSIVTDPTAAATAVASAATAGLDDAPDFDPNDEAAGVKPEVTSGEKSLNPFPEESVFEKRQAEEKAKQQAEIDAANATPPADAEPVTLIPDASTTSDAAASDAEANHIEGENT